MKLCFPVATDEGLNSSLFGHFGSTPLFAIVDTETDDVNTIGNCDLLDPDAGCNPFKALVNVHVDSVIVGGIGDGFLEMLNTFGMKVYHAQSLSVKENVELFKQDALDEVELVDSVLEGKCSDDGGEDKCSHNHDDCDGDHQCEHNH
jgi:predicted Fe-Mo cluster-binding NifX family protein